MYTQFISRYHENAKKKTLTKRLLKGENIDGKSRSNA